MLLAVTGNPILHSKSPVIFNTIFEQLGIDAVYTRIAANDAAEAVYLFNELGLIGMNVTAPFKQAVIGHLDHIDPAARKIGGVNTVVREPDGLKGYNTDHLGVTRSLHNRGIVIGGKNCIVIGAGGAGRAAVYGLMQEKADVTIVNRTHGKAIKAARHFGCRAAKIETLPELLKTTHILVSTLSAAVDRIPGEWLHPRLVVFDANYKQSPLSQKAQTVGCTVIKGEEWLLNQAVPAYRHFLGHTLDDPALLQTVRQKLLAEPPPTPKNIALIGFMGSGKTTVGQLLAERLRFTFKDLDHLLEQKTRRTIPEIFETDGEAVFRALETKILKEELPQHQRVVYGCGGGVSGAAENRQTLRADSQAVWLYSSLKTTLERIPAGTRPLLETGDPVQTARDLLNQRLPGYARTADIIVNSEPKASRVAEKIHDEISITFDN